jgi:hypothetical protein
LRKIFNYIIIVSVVGNTDWQRHLPIMKVLQTFYSGRRFLIWHTLLVIVASAAVLVQVSALFLLFLRVTHSSTSILIHASIAVLVQLSALFQLFLRVEPSAKNNKGAVHEFIRETAPFYFCIWRSQMNEKTLRVFECSGLAQPINYFCMTALDLQTS